MSMTCLSEDFSSPFISMSWTFYTIGTIDGLGTFFSTGSICFITFSSGFLSGIKLFKLACLLLSGFFTNKPWVAPPLLPLLDGFLLTWDVRFYLNFTGVCDYYFDETVKAGLGAA